MASRELTALIHLLTSRPMPENATVADRRQGFDTLAAKLPVAPDVTCDKVDAAGVPDEEPVRRQGAEHRGLWIDVFQLDGAEGIRRRWRQSRTPATCPAAIGGGSCSTAVPAVVEDTNVAEADRP